MVSQFFLSFEKTEKTNCEASCVLSPPSGIWCMTNRKCDRLMDVVSFWSLRSDSIRALVRPSVRRSVGSYVMLLLFGLGATYAVYTVPSVLPRPSV